MKSFVTYPLDFERMLYPAQSVKNFSGKLVAHYELYKKISHLEGSIVKCGITAQDGFTKFAMFQNLILPQSVQKLIAFEKFTDDFSNDHHSGHCKVQYQVEQSVIDLEQVKKELLHTGISDIDFVRGNPGDAIPEYLIHNPELKIAYLNIDLDDYDASITTLQFFYPRLVHGGILIFDNYYKKKEDYKAATDYFGYTNVIINNFSVNRGPHYIVRQ